MALSHDNERFFWILGVLLAGACLAFSHTFHVTTGTFVSGIGLFIVSICLLLLKVATRRTHKPRSLRWTSNLALTAVGAMFLLYILGVITWYE